MADVDVTQLLIDPIFTDSFIITAQTTTIDNYGRIQITETNTNAIGVIEAISKDVLSRFPEDATLTGDIVVHYKGQLYAQRPNGYCDKITFNGVTYLVKNVDENYINWGAGWVAAICQREDPSA